MSYIAQFPSHVSRNQLNLVRISCRFFGRSKATDNWPPKDIWHSEPRPRARAPLSIEYDQDRFKFPTRAPKHKQRHDWLLQLLGHYSLTEVRHRASLFFYRKCSQASEHKLFWDTFFLEDEFRVELQILGLHMWLIKSRCSTMEQPEGSKLSKQTFWAMFEDLCYRYERHIVGLISKWEKDCQTIVFSLALALDGAQEDFPEDSEAYAKAVWDNVYLKNKNMQYDVLYLWSEYLERESKALQMVDDRDFLLGYWEFGPHPVPEDLLRLRELLQEREEAGISTPCADPTKTYFGLYDIPQENPHAVGDDCHAKRVITCFFQGDQEPVTPA